MARPKIVRTKEEAAAIDPSLPIQVEVSDSPPAAAPIPNGRDGGGGAVATPSSPPPSAPPPPVIPKEEPELTSLKAQIEAMRREKEEAARQIADYQRREAEMYKQNADWGRQARTNEQRAFQAEVDAVNNGIATFESELVSAKSAARIAATTGDWDTHTEASERIGQASWNLQEYKNAKQRLEQQGERIKQQQQYYQQQPQTDEQAIDSDQRLTYQQKQWFKKHPEILHDGYKSNKLGVAHHETVNKGIRIDTPEYFEAIDIAMGYKEAPIEVEDDGPPSPLPQSVSAPVSRESVSVTTGRPATTRITLTAAQREAARDAGVDEVTYARGLLELERRKQQGLYQNG
jgi:hypothetical protein